MADCEQWLTHFVGDCQDCDATFSSRNVQGLAAQHADKYGHEVHVELGYAFRAYPEGQGDG